MKYSVATFMTQDSFAESGTKWLRSAVSQSLSGWVVGLGLGSGSIDKIAELGFKHLDVNPRTGTRADVFGTFVEKMAAGDSCLWVPPDRLPTSRLAPTCDLVCGRLEVDSMSVTAPVVNLYDKAAMMKSLDESVKAAHGCFLSSSFMLGGYDFWVGYSGCYAYLSRKQYIDPGMPGEDLVLNFFAAFAGSISVDARDYPASE